MINQALQLLRSSICIASLDVPDGFPQYFTVDRVLYEARHIAFLSATRGKQSAKRNVRFPRYFQTPPSRSEEHTSELQSLMRISYAVFCLKTIKLLLNPQCLASISRLITSSNT